MIPNTSYVKKNHSLGPWVSQKKKKINEIQKLFQVGVVKKNLMISKKIRGAVQGGKQNN